MTPVCAGFSLFDECLLMAESSRWLTVNMQATRVKQNPALDGALKVHGVGTDFWCSRSIVATALGCVLTVGSKSL